MTPRTLAELRPELTRIAGQTGMRIDDVSFLGRLNLVVERLMIEGNLPQCVARLRFANLGGLIALPLGYDALLKVCLDDAPRPVQNPWYEFLQYGPGAQDGANAWSSHVVDRGESPVIIPPDWPAGIVPPVRLRFYSAADERPAGAEPGARPTGRVLGYDTAGNWVRTLEIDTWADGESFELNGDLPEPDHFADTVATWSRVETILLPVRRGIVEAYYLDADDVEFFAGRYGHTETHPMYRIYSCPEVAADRNFSVLGLCRRRFVPVREDNDLVTISNLNALRLGMIALKLEDSSEWPAAEEAWSRARAILNREARNYVTRRPALDWDADATGFGSIAHVT